MVCKKCTKKLAKLGAPDPWKEGSRNSKIDTSGGGKAGRKLNENKMLSSKKNKFQPYSKLPKCRICKSAVHQAHGHYCQACAFSKGICAMCGKVVQDTGNHNMSSY